MNGADLSPEMLWLGYCQGYFPMTVYANEVEWLAPKVRALFPISGIHVSHSLKKRLRRGEFQITFDTQFEQVVRSCMRPGDNWISDDFVRVYTEIHRLGWGHSCEVWKQENLVGGVYGLALGSFFCAESMFHTERDTSKIALWAMVNKCRDLGFTVFDAQIMNPHLASLGAFEISHEDYLVLLQRALKQATEWSPDMLAPS